MSEYESWEVVARDGITTSTYRLRVPGGWLYRYHYSGSVFQVVFVPAPPEEDKTR